MNEQRAIQQSAEKAVLRASAVDQANKNPLPGAAKEAFGLRQEIPIAEGLSVRPVVDYDIVVMSELGLAEFDSVNQTEKAAMLCFLFTTPIVEVRKLLRKSVDDFAETAIAKFFENEANRSQVDKIGHAIAEQHRRYMETRQSFAAKEEGKEGEHFFQDSAESQKTDAVGS